MSKKFHLLLLLPALSWAQIKTVIQDSETKEPIPYVNVSVKEKSVEWNADENGNMVIPDIQGAQYITLSAVGYANTTFSIAEIGNVLLLKPQPILINEVVIANKKHKHSLVLNPFKKAKDMYFGASGGTSGSLISARYIPYKEEYANTPYIEKIRLKVMAYSKSTFNVRLCAVNPDGTPGAYLYDENILVTVDKKQKYAEIDLSKLTISMPKEGFFVVKEILALNENRLTPIEKEAKLPANVYAYGPAIFCGFSSEKGGWSFKNGKWEENPATPKGYGGPLVEITLTD